MHISENGKVLIAVDSGKPQQNSCCCWVLTPCETLAGATCGDPGYPGSHDCWYLRYEQIAPPPAPPDQIPTGMVQRYILATISNVNLNTDCCDPAHPGHSGSFKASSNSWSGEDEHQVLLEWDSVCWWTYETTNANRQITLKKYSDGDCEDDEETWVSERIRYEVGFAPGDPDGAWWAFIIADFHEDAGLPFDKIYLFRQDPSEETESPCDDPPDFDENGCNGCNTMGGAYPGVLCLGDDGSILCDPHCFGASTIHATNIDEIAEYAGSVVRLDDGNCYTVSDELQAVCPHGEVTVDEEYNDCDECCEDEIS